MVRTPGSNTPLNHGYTLIAHHEDENFNPFHPDPMGALLEAYTWIAQPIRSGGGEKVYSSDRFNDLTTMLRRALGREQPIVEKETK